MKKITLLAYCLFTVSAFAQSGSVKNNLSRQKAEADENIGLFDLNKDTCKYKYEIGIGLATPSTILTRQVMSNISFKIIII